jgi:hypothetical protein
MICSFKRFFDIQVNSNRGNITIEVYGHAVCKRHALKRRAVECLKARLARIQCFILLNVSFDNS